MIKQSQMNVRVSVRGAFETDTGQGGGGVLKSVYWVLYEQTFRALRDVNGTVPPVPPACDPRTRRRRPSGRVVRRALTHSLAQVVVLC